MHLFEFFYQYRLFQLTWITSTTRPKPLYNQIDAFRLQLKILLCQLQQRLILAAQEFKEVHQ